MKFKNLYSTLLVGALSFYPIVELTRLIIEYILNGRYANAIWNIDNFLGDKIQPLGVYLELIFIWGCYIGMLIYVYRLDRAE